MVMLKKKKKKKKAVKAPALFYPSKRNLKVKASRDGFLCSSGVILFTRL